MSIRYNVVRNMVLQAELFRGILSESDASDKLINCLKTLSLKYEEIGIRKIDIKDKPYIVVTSMNRNIAILSFDEDKHELYIEMDERAFNGNARTEDEIQNGNVTRSFFFPIESEERRKILDEIELSYSGLGLKHCDTYISLSIQLTEEFYMQQLHDILQSLICVYHKNYRKTIKKYGYDKDNYQEILCQEIFFAED